MRVMKVGRRSIRRWALGWAVLGGGFVSGARGGGADDLAAAIQAALGDESTRAVWQVGTPFEGVEGAWQAPNREQGLRTYFLPEGPRLVPRGDERAWSFGLRLASIARGDGRLVPSPGRIEAGPERVEYHRAGLVEWYRNDAQGLEQGFDIPERLLEAQGAAPLELELAFDGDLRLENVLGAVGATFAAGADGPRLSLTKLLAFDSHGRDLPCRFERRGERLALIVDDRGAHYPIVVDPTVQNESAKLTLEGPPERTAFGSAIDLAGELALVGAPGDGSTAGAAYVFRRWGTSWHLDAKLVGGTARVDDRFGASVAIDASHALVGAPGHDQGTSDSGAVFVYRNQGGTWVPAQVARAPFPQAGAALGASVALGAGWFAAGAPYEDAIGVDSGAVHLFRLHSGTWSHHERLLPSGVGPGDRLGFAVDISGARLAMGAPGNGGWVYVHQNTAPGTWTPLTALRHATFSDFGYALALVGDGLLVGSPNTSGTGLPERGRAGYFRYDGTQFNEQWTSAGDAPGERLGEAVALDAPLGGPARALVGAPGSSSPHAGAGNVRPFSSPDGVSWSQGAPIVAHEARALERFGCALALQGDTALVGLADGVLGERVVGEVQRLAWNGSTWVHVESWFARDRSAGDLLGHSTAILGDLAVVGAPGESDAAFRAGAVYVFQREAGVWSQRHRLTAGVFAQNGAEFGASIALGADGRELLVGAPLEDGGTPASGAVYRFKWVQGDVWKRRERLTPWDGASGARFGSALAMIGDLAVVGAPGADGASPLSGAVYLFRHDGEGYDAEAKLYPAQGQSDDEFGAALWCDGEELVVGAPSAGTLHPFAGAVEVFRRTNGSWGHVHSIRGGAPSAGLGTALAVDGDSLLVGAPGALDHRGAVRIHRREGTQWTFLESLLASGGVAGDRFGESLVARDGRWLVGAPRRTEQALRGGAAYRYDATPFGRRESILLPSVALPTARFGQAVALAEDALLVGSPYASDDELHAGAAYVFDVELPSPFEPFGFGDGSSGPCGCQGPSAPGAGQGCANSTGQGASLLGGGTASVAADDLVLLAENLAPSQPGLLFCGTQALVGVPFGDGLRFVGGFVRRLGVRAADVQGRAQWVALSGAGGWQTSDVRYFQVWYRDPGVSVCSQFFNLSSALQVTFVD